MKFSDDQVTIRELRFNSDEEIDKLDENITKLKVCGSRRNSVESKSPTSKVYGKCGRPANPLPRHKRDSHIKAEHKRRDKIQKGFDTLREMVPALENCSPKESKSSMLFKTAEHCRQLKVECKAQQDEALALRHEIESLGNQIHALQGRLPAMGIKVPEKSNDDMEKLCSKYIKKKTKENWKFWIFSLVMKPLFETYKASVDGSTSEGFIDAVWKWVDQNLSLISLRPAILSALRKLCTQTKIMDKPNLLKMDVLEHISKLGDEMDECVVIKNDLKSGGKLNQTNMKETTYQSQIQVSTMLPNHFSGTNYSSMQTNSDIASLPSTSQNLFMPSMNTHTYHDTNFKTPSFLSTEVKENDLPIDFSMAQKDFLENGLALLPDECLPSDMIFTTSEDTTLYDSILNCFSSTNNIGTCSSHDQINLQSFHEMNDASLDLFPTSHQNCSSFPEIKTSEHSFHQSADMVTYPSFADLNLLPATLESSVDPISFQSETDLKDAVNLPLNPNKHSFAHHL